MQRGRRVALCLGAVLAYPVKWRTRLAGAGGGAALILGLNTLRIGTLGRVAASPAWFNALHVYVWPAVLTLAIAGYVFGWMRLADRRHTLDEKEVAPREPFLTAASETDATIRRAHGCIPAPVFGGLAALSPECQRLRAGRLHRPRGCSDPRCRRRQRARGGQRALDAARGLPRHAGMHFDAADPGLSGSHLCLLDDMAAADPGRPRRRAAFHRPWHRATSRGRPA